MLYYYQSNKESMKIIELSQKIPINELRLIEQLVDNYNRALTVDPKKDVIDATSMFTVMLNDSIEYRKTFEDLNVFHYVNHCAAVQYNNKNIGWNVLSNLVSTINLEKVNASDLNAHFQVFPLNESHYVIHEHIFKYYKNFNYFPEEMSMPKERLAELLKLAYQTLQKLSDLPKFAQQLNTYLNDIQKNKNTSMGSNEIEVGLLDMMTVNNLTILPNFGSNTNTPPYYEKIVEVFHAYVESLDKMVLQEINFSL